MNGIIKKRGDYHPAAILLIPAICLLLVFGFFFLPILAELMGIQETTYFEKNFLVRDMATLTDALYAAPGNIIVNYDKDTKWFSYEFNKNEIAVFDETTALKTKTKYHIIGNSLLNFNPITLNATFNSEDKSKENLKERVKPIFAKINDDIIIKEKLDRNINEIKCINTAQIGELSSKVILIDSAHGSDDNGITVNNVIEKEVTGAIGFSAYQNLKDNKLFTREIDDYQIRKEEYKNKERIKEEIEKNNIGIIISIHSGSYDDDSNNIKAYYSIESNENVQAQSRQVACKVLNELVNKEDLEITGISMIPIYPEDYEGGEILVKDKASILLEIGNLKNQKSANMLTSAQNIQTISNSIIEGLKKC